MDAKEFRLKNGKYEPRFTTEKRYLLYEADEVERLMEEYHQSKVNNVVLDDVIVCEDCNNIGEESKKLGKVLCDKCFDIAISKL